MSVILISEPEPMEKLRNISRKREMEELCLCLPERRIYQCKVFSYLY